MTSFSGDLAIALSLTIDGQAYEVPSGNVKSLELELLPYGYNGKLSFVISPELAEDTLFTPLTQNHLISVSLQVRAYNETATDEGTALTLKGLATKRGFAEQTLSNILKTQDTLVSRHYRLEFADPAQVLWKQHYPCDLMTSAKLQDLIAAHAPSEITLAYDWPELQLQHHMLALSLGMPGNPASFYDYLCWLADIKNGVFTYDAANNKYTLSAVKSQTGEAVSLDPNEIAGFGVDFAELNFYKPNVLNAYSVTPQTTPVPNSLTVNPIRRDYIARYPIAADMIERVALETARLKQPMHEVWLDYQAFQNSVTLPGQLVNFKGSSAWNESIYIQANTYRVKEWRLTARAAQPELLLHLNEPYSSYVMEHSLRLENSAELCAALPSYRLPVYPVFVEGKMDSDTGEDTDATYQFYTDSDTSINYYQVIIPLWNNQKIRVAYQPNFDAGQFYFPPYKNARVLVGLEFNRAYIAAFLDWGAGTALPLSSQGNQLVMGTSTTSQNIIKHSYVDSKPELQIQRTQDKDTELLQFSDGYIILQTQTSTDS